ncbi:MAG TPA: sigma-70 family RNA polymerase sigma factor, partial [Planctomycetota bacterium]|nr:sigma-70 family RNA polymerase sigma factor [Planctomycetota bacterium]
MDSSRSPTEALLGEVAFVHRLARALLRDDGLAHDAAQDALTAALQHQPARHVRGWLAAVTRHLAGRAGRDARERAAREAQAARPPSHDGEARTAERLRLHRRLFDAVVALPEPYRTAVTLRFFDELPPRAIAKRLGLPAATVRQRVHRGLAMLRQQLDREFGGELGGRDGWRGAFAAVGLGKTTVSVLPWLLPVLAMKKVVVGAALAAVVGVGWWSWPRSNALPVVSQVANAPASPAAARLASNATAANESKVDTVRTAAAPPPARGETFVVRVVDEREQPIAGADVHRWTAAGATTKQRTGRDGRSEFAAIDGEGGVLVRANGFAPLSRELESLRGHVECTLPDGAVLEGQVLVDGAPAPAGLRVGVHAPLVLPESAPRALREVVPDWRPSATAMTGPGGRFLFRGLAADRKVRLELSRTHWFLLEEGRIPEFDDRLHTRSLLPARGVLLHTTQLPTVYGRAVWDDDGTPVCAPEVTVFAQFANGDGSPGLSFMGNDDGTFATGFYPGGSGEWQRWCDPTKRVPLASVRMSVEAAGSDGSVRVDLDEKALAAMPVEVRLPRAAVTHFIVTDLDDRPIAGARVSATPSTVTDEHGRGTFQGKRDKVLVGADGYQVQPAVSHRPAAGTHSDPLRLRLAPRNHLVLTVRSEAGGVPPIRSLSIVSNSGHLFQGKRFHHSFDQTFGGSDAYGHSSGRTQADGSTETYEWSCTTRPDANGRVELHSLEPGVPCTVTATDALGSIVATATIVTPPAGETCNVDLVVAGVPRSVRGRV